MSCLDNPPTNSNCKTRDDKNKMKYNANNVLCIIQTHQNVVADIIRDYTRSDLDAECQDLYYETI